MAFAPNLLLAHAFEEIEQSYIARDAILYALGLGYGVDAADLDFVLETRLKVLPMMAVTLASPGMWIRDPRFGVTFNKLVHIAQEAEFHGALPPAATVAARPRVSGVYDRGDQRGAVVIVEREIRDAGSGAHYASVRQTLLLRGDGGFGGAAPPTEQATPELRGETAEVRYAISPRAALIYRLSGDYNPLHADPAVAKSAGFERPILHGLASYGLAGRAILETTGRSLRSLACRFSGVVFPGDDIRFTINHEADRAAFVAHVGDRKVLDRGEAQLS